MFMRKPREKKYRWDPIVCGGQDLLEVFALEQELGLFLTIRYQGTIYRTGINTDGYDRKTKTFATHIFYLEDEEYPTLEAFAADARLDGRLIKNIASGIEILEEACCGDPRKDKFLAALEQKG